MTKLKLKTRVHTTERRTCSQYGSSSNYDVELHHNDVRHAQTWHSKPKKPTPSLKVIWGTKPTGANKNLKQVGNKVPTACDSASVNNHVKESRLW